MNFHLCNKQQKLACSAVPRNCNCQMLLLQPVGEGPTESIAGQEFRSATVTQHMAAAQAVRNGKADWG